MGTRTSNGTGKRAADPAAIYDWSFYDRQMGASLASARIFVRHLWNYLQPAAVLDVGCGRGTWLLACKEMGCERLVGYDGEWNEAALMVDPDIVFKAVDLSERFASGEKFDLALCLEVGEHLEERCAERLVESLAAASDCVLFSAALVGQGGCRHINEQMPSWWAERFMRHGFVPFDLFRPALWGREEACFWYRQNAFLYARFGSAPHAALAACGVRELADTAFMDCIHPRLYAQKIADKDIMTQLDDLDRSLLRALKRRVRRLMPGKAEGAL